MQEVESGRRVNLLLQVQSIDIFINKLTNLPGVEPHPGRVRFAWPS